MASAVVVMVAAASLEEAFTAAASVVAVFEVEALPVVVFEVEAFAVPLTVVVFAAVAFAVALTIMVFATMVLAVIGSAAETSTIGPSSLAIFGIHSFIIPTLTTGTIPTAIILTVTDTTLTMNLFTKAALDMPAL